MVIVGASGYQIGMKVEARLSETGERIRARVDEEWSRVYCHPKRHKPVLYCPEETCNNRLKAVERARKDGGKTRYFAFESGAKCSHRAVKSGVIVPAASPSSPESGEHKWLKNYVLEAAHRLGYNEASAEYTLANVRADVYVPTAHRQRVEVQRGQTDIPMRTSVASDVIWLLRMPNDASNKRYLFNMPCVQVRIIDPEAGPGQARAAQPWQNDQPRALVRATSTVLCPRTDPDVDSDFGYFTTEKYMPLDTFLKQVWSGRRRWYPSGAVHKFAGWVNVADYDRYQQWMTARKQHEEAAKRARQEPEESAALHEPAEPGLPDDPEPAPEDPGPVQHPPPGPIKPPPPSRSPSITHTEASSNSTRGGEKPENPSRKRPNVFTRIMRWLTGG